MTTADLPSIPTERFLVPASGIGRRSWQGEAKTSGGAEAGVEAAFPELLSRLAEAGGGGATTPLQADVQNGLGDALLSLGGDLDHTLEPAANVPASTDAALPTPAATDLLSGASMLAALMAGSTPIPSGTQGEIAPASDVSDIAEQLKAVADPELPLQVGVGDSAKSVPEPGADLDVAGPAPKVTVLRQETHLAPASAQLSVERVAQPLVAALAPIINQEGKAPSPAGEGQAALPDAAVPAEKSDSEMPALPQAAPAPRGKDLGSASSQHPSGGQAKVSATTGEDGAAASQSFADAGDGVAAVRKELNPAPSQAPASPIGQIADHIVRESLTGAGSARPAALPNPSAKSAALTAVKVLHIELQPADLGTVTVRMSLKDGALELQLDAGREETARLLQKDRDTLSNILRAAGYQIDAMTVRVAEPDRAAPAPAASSTFSGSTQSQPGSAQPDAKSSGGQDHAGRPFDSHRATGTSQDEESGAANHLGGDVYV